VPTSSVGTSSAPTVPSGPPTAEDSGRMTHRQTLKAMSGMLLAMFTAFLSSTIVSNALPTIIIDLHGTQNQYTWVVTATLLASTATTPIWGKLADLFSKKLLVQLSITIFTVGSVLAGFSQSVSTLIAWRTLQGIGLGGLQALIMIVVAAMISPRERGKFMGPIGAVFSVAPVAGPLIGGVIVDTDWLGWRWCFWVGAPLALVALIVVQRTLNLPVVKRKVSIDYLGAVLIAAGVSDLLIWVTLAGHSFAWDSSTSLLLVAIGVVLIGLAILVEARVKEPIIPLRLFRDRTTTLATIGSIAVGTAMFGGAVFLGQYFQVARGYSPTAAGLLSLPMIIGSMISSTTSGVLITRLGRWKGFLVAGALLMVAAFGFLGTIDHATDMVLLGAYLFVLGLGMGMLMQNLVLAVQNSVAVTDLGAASSMVTFFRSLGGTVGVSVLGAVLATRVSDLTVRGLSEAGVAVPTGGGIDDVGIGSLNQLPAALAGIVRVAYGDATALIFLVSAGIAVLTLLSVLFIKEVPLRTKSGLELEREQRGDREAHGLVTDAAPEFEHQPVPEPASVGGDQNGHRASGLALDSGGGNGRHLGDHFPPAPASVHGTGPGPRPEIVGTVHRADGAGLADAVVTVTDPAGRQEARTTTAPDGSFRLAVPHGGTYLVVAASRTFQPHAAMVAVADRPVRHDVTLAGAGGVRGTVRTPDPQGGARPVTGVAVTLIDVRGNVAGTTVTDEIGRFHVGGVLDGQYTLTAAGAGFQPVAMSVLLGGGGAVEQDVELPRRARLLGTVTAASTGRGVPEAMATLIDASGTVVGSAVTDTDGTFIFDDIAGGTYTLTASGYAPVATLVQVTTGGTTTTEVALAPPAVTGAAPAGAPTAEQDAFSPLDTRSLL
jgi:EmrB/QacA subfamily drug resistance transporter